MKNEIKNINIDGYKVAMAFRQLESSSVLHECYDIEEEGVENILHLYGIFYKWNDDEKAIIKDQLMEMAAREEIKEAERWALMEKDPILLAIPNKPIKRKKLSESKPAESEVEKVLIKSISDDWKELLNEKKLEVS